MIALAVVSVACAPTSEPDAAVGFAAGAVDFPLEAAGGQLDPGTYLLGALGTEVQLTTTDPWDLPRAGDGAVILAWPEAPAPFTRALLMLRPVEPVMGPEVYDAAGAWIEELDDVEILDRSDVTVGGVDAVRFDLTATVDEVPFLLSPPLGGPMVLRNSEVYRVWFVEQASETPPERPMVFFAPVLSDDTDWLSEAEAVVDSMVLGPVAPPPGPDADGANAQGFFNSSEFPLGILAFDLIGDATPAEHFPGFVTAELPPGEGEVVGPTVVFIAVTQTADGVPLPDAAAFLAEVTARDGEIVEHGAPVTILGEAITGYVSQSDAIGPISVAPVGEEPDSLPILTGAPEGVDYLVDTPDGLLLVGATGENPGSLEVALDLLREMSTSISVD